MLNTKTTGLIQKAIHGLMVLMISTLYCSVAAQIDGIRMTDQVSLVSIDGQSEINISETKNVVVLHIWASWCGYCRREHELWCRMNKKPGVDYYSVSFRESPEDAMTFLAEKGDPFDQHFTLDYENAKKINARTIPDTLVIYQNKIIFRHRGSMNEEKFDRFINKIDSIVDQLRS